MRKIMHWFNEAVCHISAPEVFTIALNVAVYILCGSFTQHFYLWMLIILCDVMVICSHGAWLEAKGDEVYGPWRTPTPHVARFIASVVLLLLAARHQSDIILSTYIWYTITATAVCHAFFCVLRTMHQADNSWLEGTNGRVGMPNWISIIRMAISVLVPHLYAAQPFGEISSLIATIALIAAIVTDAADGFVARRFNQITKAGQALDPLGDKVIFYPTAIAFIIATHGTAFLGTNALRLIFYVCIGTMFARDALFFVWFFLYYTKLEKGIGASMVDKIRMAAMCAWLGCSALAMTFAEMESRLAIAGLACIIVVALLSIISVIVDYGRIKPLVAKNKPIEHRPDIYDDEA